MRTFCLALVSLNLLVSSAHAGTSGLNSGSSTITFSTITGGGTCTTSVDTPIQIGAQAGIDPSSAINKNWIGLSPKAFNVNLNNCAGVAINNQAPYITLTGTTLIGNKSPEAQDRLFSSGSNATGFGVIIYNTNAPGAGTTNIVTKSGGTIPIPDHGKGTILNGNFTVPLVAAVGCGGVADCAVADLKSGSLSASITFGFAYK
ncbi:hypothetical protein [Providencia alcalifaciens]|uniref:hypothetical protein n=1 Tax=Providencia alcalifaciens TaxID=126385 RepID=UPI002B05507C|nr:hypothetical protein [Providencia alcalifaciens]